MPDIEINEATVNAFRSTARIEAAHKVIIIKAWVLYYDTAENKVLFREEAPVNIDSMQDYRVTIPALSYDDRCFSEFSTRFQDFTFDAGVLTISGTGNAQKHSYKVTLI